MKNKEQAKQIIIKGRATAPGIAVGPAFVFKPFSLNLTEIRSSADSVDEEIDLFESARLKVLDQLIFAQKQSNEAYGNEFAEIFESQIAFLNDKILLDEIKSLVNDNGNSAGYAVSSVLAKKSEHFINLENTYFRERAFDIIDLKQKLLLALFDIQIDYQLTHPSIVVTESLSPTDTVNFNRNLILGFLTDRGGETSHSAILARGLKIPSVVNGKKLSEIISTNDLLIIDGFEGTIIVNPDNETRKKYLNLKFKHEQQVAALVASNPKEAITKDSVKIDVNANIEFANEVSDVFEYKADGVGLFRTETLFLEGKSVPGEDKQFKIYKQIAKSLKNKSFVIRTIDLGGDKLLDGYNDESEKNPFLGWRAIRFCLDNPNIFKPQIKAILKASQFGDVRILLPMVNTVGEILQVKELISEVRHELNTAGLNIPESVKLGIMIETPAAAVMASILAKYVDFLSIGSNDLTQYTLAVDRTNAKIAQNYCSFEPSVIRLMHTTVNAGIANNIPVSICGEFAAVPQALPILLGMGIRSLSVTPTSIPLIKKIISSVQINACIKLYDKIQMFHHASEIEAECEQFIKNNVPELSFSKEDA
jgi:phosphoenolpyruvate-protein phosphotransferase (PTS system enzyme I)